MKLDYMRPVRFVVNWMVLCVPIGLFLFIQRPSYEQVKQLLTGKVWVWIWE
jgi:hypothetical protein